MKSSLFRQAAFFFYAEKQAENEPISFFVQEPLNKMASGLVLLTKRAYICLTEKIKELAALVRLGNSSN